MRAFCEGVRSVNGGGAEAVVSWLGKGGEGACLVYGRRMNLTLEIPDDLARALPLPPEEQESRLQTEMACLLYAKAWLSFGQAARLSGLDHHRFGLELGDRDIPRHYTEEEADHDLEYASRQQHVSGL